MYALTKSSQKYFLIFSSYFLVRILFALVMGFHQNYYLQFDSTSFINFADNALKGNFNFDYGRFVAAPVYPIFIAIHKLLFANYWNTILVFSQLIISSLSGIYIYKIIRLLFKEEAVAIISTVLYGLFPLTFWYVHTFSQETLFQCLFIFSIYHLIVAYKSNNIKSLIYSAILFSIAYLTKSHVLLVTLFIPIVFYFNLKTKKQMIQYTILFASICFVFSLPYGLYHLHRNGTYILSSNGSGFQFYLGNTKAGYITIVDVPEKTSYAYIVMNHSSISAGYLNDNNKRFDSIMALSQNIKQKLFFKEAFNWIKHNHYKWIKMKIYDVGLFINPGVSYRHYPFKEWLISFILSFPLYILAYIGIIINLKKNFKEHIYILSIFISMLLFSTIFYVQNRFRTVTLEPFYLIYAAYTIYYLYIKYKSRLRIINNILFTLK